ncbi:MAG: hypothetical protein QOF78_598 [Phycisphaerales bacterium]|nr:hypothetical protein [Phycisphaerales bacterium]
MTFHEKLRRLMEDRNRSAVARRVGVSVTTFNNYCTRDVQPLAENALRIARALNVSLEWLLDDARGWPPVWTNHEAQLAESAPAA